MWDQKLYNVETMQIDRASLFTNQRELDENFAWKLYKDTGQMKTRVHSNITLHPISFKRHLNDDESLRVVTFRRRANFIDLFHKFREGDIVHVANKYRRRYGDDLEKRYMLSRNRFLERCKFEPIAK